MSRRNNSIRTCALLLAILLLAWTPAALSQSCGNPGTDGPGIISGIVNTYYAGAASVGAGSKTISISAADAGGNTAPLTAGDLLLIIQMQDATITRTNGAGYGAVTAATAGNYEFAVASAYTAGNPGSVTVATNLTNSYTVAAAGAQGQKRFQVIRVPQYASVTLGSIRAMAWNGSAGGVVAFDVAGTLNLAGGTIDASGKGFRGGGGAQLAGGNTGAETDYGRPYTVNWGGSKGEGIAGTPRLVSDGVSAVLTAGTEPWTGNPAAASGSFLRGAPGNAGGGGNDSDPAGNSQNAGGGGGANGGAGGIGGNTWSTNLAYGGVGGYTFTLASSSRVVMGGGGGAGSNNNSPAYRSSGAAGGGIVIVRAGVVSGSGVINASGADAPSPDNDGAGGGGAGGSVVVFTRSGTLSGLTINANGGQGGDNWVTQAQGGSPGNQHGPGGGGGGGVVYQSGGASVNVNGGTHGTTTTGATAYGSDDGDAGVSGTVAAANFTGALQGAACVPVLTVTKSTTTPTAAPGGTATYKITIKNATGVATASQVNISDTLPQPVANTFTFNSTTLVTLSGGATRPSTTNPAANATVPAWSTFTIPAGGQVDITFVIKIASTVPTNIYQNPATATYLDPARSVTTGTTSAAYDPTSSTNEDVWVRTMLSGIVYSDANHDGNHDGGEDWSGGVSLFVNLVQGGAVVQSINVPAGTGSFSFATVAAGSYTVVVTTSATSTAATPPNGWIATMPTPLSYTFTLATNPILNLNFGLFNGTKVSGTVFQDDGTGSGTANNGVQDGTEIGLTNFTLKATDAGSTTYDQTATDSAGRYILWLPAGATSVRITETNSNGYISTGGSIGNSGGTYSRTTDTISFTDTGLIYAALNFGEIPSSTLAPSGALQTLPNTSVFYPHTFVASSTGQVTFTATDVPRPVMNGYGETFYRDTNCNGQLDAGEPQITGAIAVTAGTTVCFLVKAFVPGTAPFDATDSITVTAQLVLTNAAPALTLTYTTSDLTTVGTPKNAGLRLEKAVDRATAISGTVITYTITFINDSSGPLSSIVINDSTPAYTTFQTASCGAPLPSGVSGCSVTTQPAVGSAGTVQWTLTGGMNASQSGTVTFSVKVN